MKKLSLIVLMMSLALLNGCSSKNSINTEPPPLIRTKFVTKKIPKELLEPTKAPNPEMLKGVKVCKGENRAKLYVKELLLAWYENKTKIEKIKELEEVK